MATDTLVATYREGDKYIVEAEVDCLTFRYQFTDPDVEKELLFQLIDDEDKGMHYLARYEVMEVVQAAIDCGAVDRSFDGPPAVWPAPVSDFYDRHRELIDELRTRCEDWRGLFGWSLLANGVLLCLVVWRAGR